jgi:hypothetical protein
VNGGMNTQIEKNILAAGEKNRPPRFDGDILDATV